MYELIQNTGLTIGLVIYYLFKSKDYIFSFKKNLKINMIVIFVTIILLLSVFIYFYMSSKNKDHYIEAVNKANSLYDEIIYDSSQLPYDITDFILIESPINNNYYEDLIKSMLNEMHKMEEDNNKLIQDTHTTTTNVEISVKQTLYDELSPQNDEKCKLEKTTEIIEAMDTIESMDTIKTELFEDNRKVKQTTDTIESMDTIKTELFEDNIKVKQQTELKETSDEHSKNKQTMEPMEPTEPTEPTEPKETSDEHSKNKQTTEPKETSDEPKEIKEIVESTEIIEPTELPKRGRKKNNTKTPRKYKKK
jgi:hypothetical protein